MNRTRWIQFGVLLAVAFVLSVGVGALIGRQRTGTPVASIPTPTPAVTPSATPSQAPATPTTALTPSPSPVPPTTPPTTTPTIPATVPPASLSTASPPTLDPPTATQFADALLAAFQTGDTEYLLERLHPLVFERYGERQCRRHVSGLPDPSASWTVLSESGPAPWDWITDELTTTVTDTWTVVVEIPDEGEREVHFAPFEATWRWFLDCGDPR